MLSVEDVLACAIGETRNVFFAWLPPELPSPVGSALSENTMNTNTQNKILSTVVLDNDQHRLQLAD